MYGIFHIRSVSVGLDSQIWYLFIYITGYLNVRKISETMDFRTFVGPLSSTKVTVQFNNLDDWLAGAIFISRAAAESNSAFRWICWEGDVCLLINSLDLLGRGCLSIFLQYLLIYTFNFWFYLLGRVFWVRLDMDDILFLVLKCLLCITSKIRLTKTNSGTPFA